MNTVSSLINNQRPYTGYNPFAEDFSLPPSAQLQRVAQEESNSSKGAFKFSGLPNVLRYLAASFFNCSELVRLSSTCRANTHMLVANAGKISPYILPHLRIIKVLTPTDLYNFKQMSKITDGSLILRECHKLVHLIAKGDNRMYKCGEREAGIGPAELKKSIECCPDLQYLSMLEFSISPTISLIKLKPWKGLFLDKDIYTIYDAELNAIAESPELTHLKIKYKRHISDLDLMGALRNLKNLTYLEIPKKVCFEGPWREPLNYKEVKELIDRHVYIRMTGKGLDSYYDN